MNSWKTGFWILWSSCLLCSASYTLSVPFLPLFLFELGVGRDTVNLWAGIVYSSAFAAGFLMAPVWGSMADKYGKRRMVIRAGFSLALAYTLYTFVQNPWQLILVRLLHGFVGGFVPASMAIVASTAPRERMAWSLGMMQAATMAGGIAGPLLGGVLAKLFGMRLSFVVSAVLMALAVAAVMLWVRDSHAPAAAGPKSRIRDDLAFAFRNPTLRMTLLLFATLQACLNMVQPLIPLHIAALTGDAQSAVLSSGVVLFLVGAAGIIGSPMWGRIGERLHYDRTLFLCLSCAGGAAIVQSAVHHLWLFAAVQIVFGLFVSGASPLGNSIVVRNTPADFRGRTFGLTQSANQLGAMLGPLISGAIGAFWSIHALFAVMGAMLLLTGGAVLAWFRQQGERIEADRPTGANETISRHHS